MGKIILAPCFCGNTDPEEFDIRVNKMSCLKCPTLRLSTTSTSKEEMIAVWNTRGEATTDLNSAILTLIDRYSTRMRSELLANEEKGDFLLWSPSPADLESEIQHHLNKLNKAIVAAQENDCVESRSEVAEYAADVGNYMAKATQLYSEK